MSHDACVNSKNHKIICKFIMKFFKKFYLNPINIKIDNNLLEPKIINSTTKNLQLFVLEIRRLYDFLMCYPIFCESSFKQVFQVIHGYIFLNDIPFIHTFDIIDDQLIHLKYIEIKTLRIIQSANRPLEITFIDDLMIKHQYLYKRGVNLMKDVCIVNIFKIFSNYLNVRIIEYKIIVFSKYDGLIEMVPNITFDIQFKRFISNLLDLKDYDISKNEIFIHTLSFYTLSTFLCGIGDRTDGNVCFTENAIFHIDFSYIFGSKPKTNFLTPDDTFFFPSFVKTLLSTKPIFASKVLRTMKNMYKIMRLNSKSILDKIETLFQKQVFFDIDSISAMNYLREKFKLNLEDNQANLFIENLFYNEVRTLNSYITSGLNTAGRVFRSFL
ncbi:hypothetical protein EDEG_00334 [Edhazardia aedis USNM 41457]|uniref:PI3K/PI4K catalytic domain-containing protein n=1 Tax=Edhazardia aedis (strain USNM 41457) TaxID=1003232 RepID=J9D2U9_EDHAE|nr:hypothetical protein EDEG_00334 [Edhazardia aedis USNM 41457]|eukprot:EJW01904.1 hypothetical protein EDEG_00334 [Edhazardia aedis USNM 41457]